MKMKKLVSAIAALAMSVSAFAGMATVANAAETYTILYGTAVETEGVITGVDKQTDFTGDDHEETGITFSDANGVNLYNIGGSVLKANTSSGWTKNFAEPVTSGVVYFACDYSVSANSQETIKILDADGNAIFESSQSGSLGGNGDAVVGTILGKEERGWCRLARTAGYRAELTIDIDKNTVDYALYYSSANGKYTEIRNTVSGEIKSVAGMSVSKTNYGAYIDNVALYSISTGETLYDYVINYTLDESTVVDSKAAVADGVIVTAESVVTDKDGQRYYILADEVPSLTVTAGGENVLNVPVRAAETYTGNIVASTGDNLGSYSVVERDSYTYSYSKYLTDANGKVTAVANENTFTKTETPTASGDVTVGFTAYTGDAWFVEGNIGGTWYSSDKCSGGYATRGLNSSGSVNAITVAEDGIYNVTACAFTNNVNDKGSAIYIYVNSKDDANLIDTLNVNKVSITAPLTQTKEGVVLKAGDVIVIGAAETNTCLDYVLIEKTGELTTDEYVFEGIVIEDFAETALCFEVETADGTDVKSTLLSSFVGTEVSGEGEVNLGIVIVNDVAGATVNKVWLDVDDDKAYTE